MVKLDNIMADMLTNGEKDIKELLIRENVISIDDLIKCMSKYPEIDWEQINIKLSRMYQLMKRNNSDEIEPELYTLDEYPLNYLKYTDTCNNGDVLMLYSPTFMSERLYQKVRSSRMDFIKNSLSHTDYKGVNYYKCFSDKKSDDINRIVKMVKMYHEQVIRQSVLTNEKYINIFKYQEKDKLQIARDKYAEIVAYFLLYSKEFVWGDFNEFQKKLFLESVVTDREKAIYTKELLIKYIANYTTLDELEKVYRNEYSILKRFIVK